MENDIPKIDLPQDWVIGKLSIEDIGLLNLYANYPCRLKADHPEDGGGVYTGMVKEPFILIREQAIHEFIRQAIRRRETPLPVRCDTCA